MKSEDVVAGSSANWNLLKRQDWQEVAEMLMKNKVPVVFGQQHLVSDLQVTKDNIT